MSLEKASPSEAHNDILRQGLEYLYARRMAVNNLIRSLEDYSTGENTLVERGLKGTGTRPRRGNS